jgi:PAS domain S-box-containing protein
MKRASEIRVLHVDDDCAVLNISKNILTEEEGSFIIEVATSVDEAIEKVSSKEFDVVVSDYDMPHKNGLDLLKAIRENCSDLPFILFTGKDREEIIVKALNLGADRYINKYGEPEVVYTELVLGIRQLYEKATAQKLLGESEERFEKMVTNSKDVIMLTQADGVILYISPSCKTVLGHEPEELIGKVPWIIHPDDLECAKTIFFSALTNHMSGTAEYRILTKQGQTRWINHSFSQIVENGKIKEVVSTIQDITKAKEEHIKLVESEARFRLAIKNSQLMMATLNRNLQYTWVHNHKIKLSNAAFLGKAFGEVMVIHDCENLRHAMLGLLEKGGSLRREVIVEHENHLMVMDCYFEPYTDETGQALGISFSAYDITESKQKLAPNCQTAR